ncbi:MAG TPA: hypothetical protein VGR46_11255 [Candidatus Limnocylindria bacterium]|jgi:hypothetical protein|nr:hypothetical protein [Candidatus Limnocylindria bacterium]
MTYPAGATRAFQYGLGIFALTALIGLTNATKIIGDVDRNTLLTHLHSGTLGWITMGVFGIAVAIFGGNATTLPRNVLLSALATAAYVLAFWSGNFYARAIFGVIELVVIVGWWWWVVQRVMSEGYGRLSNPKLSVVLGLTTLVIGSTLGVIVQILYATNNLNEQNGVLIGAHASAQVGGYLILVAAGVAEWVLNPAGGRTRGGEIQSWLLFLAGLTLAIGFLANVQPFLLVSNVLQLAGIVMVAVRLGGRVLGAAWGAPTGARHAAIAIPFMVLGLVLLIALVQMSIAAQGDFSKIPPGFFNALNHTMFVGLSTNMLFGALLTLLADHPRVWPWADHVIFWGLNIGAASFIAVLIFVGTSAGSSAFSHPVAFTAPIMGLSALLAIVTYEMRLAAAPVAMRAPALA